jgi:acetoin utilization deacetylase AcuC-like enzyme
MKIIYSNKHLCHDPKLYFSMGRMQEYPETPSRVSQILSKVQETPNNTIDKPIDHGMSHILKIHTQEYVDYFQTAYEKWIARGGDLNGVIPDTFALRLNTLYQDITKYPNLFTKAGVFTFDTAAVIAKDTFDVAYEAVQITLTAADLTLSNQNSFALCRPPGHHSGEELMGGFCFFNNAAIATQYIIDKTKSKVVVLDVDYHHGNGTQTIFYEKNNPLVVSLHGKDDYPFYWGDADERGQGEGLGYNFNLPLELGTEDDAYLKTLQNVIREKIVPFQADYLVVSLGVDTFKGDPVGGFALTSECFIEIGKIIKTIGVSTLFVMEGGYAVEEIGVNVFNVLQGFEM